MKHSVHVTLRQLDIFAKVARLGSVKAAARELGVSEPGISAAVGVLRRELADALYHPGAHGLVLTAQGRRLAALAGEISELAERARTTLAEPDPLGRPLHVAVTNDVEEHVIGPLLTAFSERTTAGNVHVEVASPTLFAELLDYRRTDITLGPHPGLAAARNLVTVPFLRYRMVVVAPAGHPWAERGDIAAADLERDRWLVGPGGVEPGSPTGGFFAHARIAPPDVRAFPSDAGALAAVAAGEGVMLAVLRAAHGGLRRRVLTRLAVRGTPMERLWWASTLPEDHCLSGALALRRFAITTEATQAMAGPSRGVPAAIVRPPLHATLWRSIARPQ